MSDLDLWKACQFRPWKHLTERTYANQSCIESAQAFEKRIRKANGIVMAPGHAFMSGMDWQKCILSASEDLGKKFGEDYSDEEFESVVERLTDLAIRKREILNAERTSAESIRKFNESCYNVEVFAVVEYVRDWMRILYRSSLIQAWMAFEILAGDLIEKSRTLHPECFSTEVLAKNYFTVKSMETLYSSFKKAFAADVKINAVIQHPDIKALALLRHLFAHRDGVVDGLFITQIGQPPIVSKLSHLALHMPIDLAGEELRSHIDPVIFLGYDLIEAVDAWLSCNRKP